ncbi:MAG: hypothetical protein EU535_02420 [Promethearchaeota archaeon]|nr:MAG: hypothetical protein EU535_02420 [Candidatus Lokiarchaeota archaeon]
MPSEKQENLKYECVKCGNCCRAGFEVNLEKEDIERWIKAGKLDFCHYIQVDPKCISSTGLGGFHIEEMNTLEMLQKKYQNKDYDKKLKQLKEFILMNHTYLGKGPPLPIYTFLPNLGRTPILIPKNFDIIIEGLD